MDREQVLFRLFGKYCPEGTILYTEGSPGQELYVIQNGSVRLGAARPGAATPRLLGPGELLGEDSFFARVPRSTRAEVVQDARLILVNDSNLDAVVRHGPQTAQMIFERLAGLTQGARKELTLWTLRQVLPRIAAGLIQGARGGIAPEELAESAGLFEEEVLLVLEELQRRGCLLREGPRYRAADAVQLQREIEALSAPERRG